MSALTKLVKIAKKKGLPAKWSNSDLKFDIHLSMNSRDSDTYVIAIDSVKGKIKEKYLEPAYLYRSIKANLLLKLHSKSLILLYNADGKALAIKSLNYVNIGVYHKFEIQKFLTDKEPAFQNLYKEVEQQMGGVSEQ